MQASNQAVSKGLVRVAAVPGWFRQVGSRLRGGLGSSFLDSTGRMFRAPDEIELLRVAVAAAHEKSTALEAQIADLSTRLKAHVSGARSGQPMNLTARGQILKMARSGRQPEQISAALGVPRGEVMLLLQLQIRQGRQATERDGKKQFEPSKRTAGISR